MSKPRFRYKHTIGSNGLLVLSDDGARLEVGPIAKLECSCRDCEGHAAKMVRTGVSTWRTLCDAHAHETDW